MVCTQVCIPEGAFYSRLYCRRRNDGYGSRQRVGKMCVSPGGGEVHTRMSFILRSKLRSHGRPRMARVSAISTMRLCDANSVSSAISPASPSRLVSCGGRPRNRFHEHARDGHGSQPRCATGGWPGAYILYSGKHQGVVAPANSPCWRARQFCCRPAPVDDGGG